MDEMKQVAANVGAIGPEASRRIAAGNAWRARHRAPLPKQGLADARRRLGELLPEWG
jgi:hypothetical protein